MAGTSSAVYTKNEYLLDPVDDDGYEINSGDNLGSGDDLDLPLEKLNLGPKKNLLVLCLGGLLCDRLHRRDKSPKNRRPDMISGPFKVYNRPHCEEFLKFCLEKFEVGLWSSIKERRNIDGPLNCIMIGLKSKLAFIWDQYECTETDYMTLKNSKKPIFLKELNKLWENEDRSLSWRKGQYSASNTLMIDDEPYKALLNPPNTAIFLPKYDAGNSEDEVLGVGGELQKYLDGLADADDVPTYVKQHPFGLPAITSSHSDWGFYSKIVREYGKNGKSGEDEV